MRVSEIDYSAILQEAISITWKNKFLWWFGFILALGSGGADLGKMFNQASSESPQPETLPEPEIVLNFLHSHISWVVAGIIIVLSLGIAFWLLKTICFAGLITSINSLKKNQPASFKIGFGKGKLFLGRLIVLEAIFTLAIFLLLGIITAPVVFLVFQKAYPLAIILGLIGIILILSLSFVFGFIRYFSRLYIVLSNINLRESLELSYALFAKNFIPGIVLSLLFVGIGILIGLASLIIFLPLGLVFFLIEASLRSALGLQGSAFALILFSPIFLGAGSLFGSLIIVFRETTWYLFFVKIARDPEKELGSEKISTENQERAPQPEGIAQ
jgi:hypothetical protein